MTNRTNLNNEPSTTTTLMENSINSNEKEKEKENSIIFTTMGMFIIDEIHFGELSDRPPVFDIIGGAGTYSVLGCRLFFPGPRASKQIGWIIDTGTDFPEFIKTEIEGWDTSVLFRNNPHRLTSRGWNYYGPHEERGM